MLIFGTPLDFRSATAAARTSIPRRSSSRSTSTARELGRNRACDVGIIGDTGLVMEQLTELAASEGYQKAVAAAWLADLRARREHQVGEDAARSSSSDAAPVNPLRVCTEIDGVVDDDTIVIGDGGDFVGTAADTCSPARPGHWLDPGPLGTLGVGPGYAMAAKLARPKSNVIIMYGDGSFGLNAMEFEAMRPPEDQRRRRRSATTPAGRRSAAARCSSTVRSARRRLR